MATERHGSKLSQRDPWRNRRDNVNGNYQKNFGDQHLGFRVIYGRNNFYSSGQIPLDLVSEGLLDRYGYVDPTDGGDIDLGTAAAYYSKQFGNSDNLRIDGSVGRSLFDLFSKAATSRPARSTSAYILVKAGCRSVSPRERMRM